MKRSVSSAHRAFSIVCAVILSVFLLSPAVSASSVRRDLLGRNTVFTAVLYDSLNGLPTSEANAIAQTEDGFIWIGGYSGLTRYDGTEFFHFDSKSGISSVYSLFTDSRDRLWIGTNEDGVACFDHGDITLFGRVEPLRSYSVRDMTEDDEGNIIIATTQGLAYVDAQTNEIHLLDDPQLNNDYITVLENDGFGKVYGLTLDGAVFEIESLRITAYYEASAFATENIINELYPDPDREGVLYMGTAGAELITADMNGGIHITERKATGELKNIKAILKNDHILWVAATNGLGYIDEKGDFYPLDDIPLNNSIGHIMSDHEGNLWFTSSRQGVLKLVPDRFTDISKFAGLEQMVVNSTCVNGDLLYLATDDGLTILDKDSFEQVENDLTKMLDGIRIRCVKNDSKGNMWFCTHGDLGLVCYDPKSGETVCYNAANGLSASKVRTMLELSDGSICAATGDGIFIIRNGAVSAHYSQDNSINTTEILCLAEDKNGNIYLGSDGGGIYVVSGSKVRRLGYEDGLTSGVVMQIKWDEKRGIFWIITSNSIEYMKDGNITPVKNFPYSNNLDIYFNSGADAWILSSNGLYVTKAEDLFTEKDLDFYFYNTKSGLPYITTGNSRSFLDDEGHLYISGTSGCCMVNIDTDIAENRDVNLIIPTVEIDDRTVALKDTDTVTIPAGSKKLTIDLFAITFALNNPRVNYYLEGFDSAPIHTTKQELHPVTYTNLDGGRYVFRMEVIDNETGEISKSTSINIIKETSPYESSLFWIIVAALLVLAVTLVMWVIFRRRTRALLEQKEEDEKLISQIMHTFAKCVDMRDQQNQGHSFRVAYYTKLLAQKLAWKRGYTEDKINELYYVALLHDIGKLSIPDAILNKPSRLNDEEYVIMKSHAQKGEELLKDVTVVKDLSVGAGSHHERIDGKGYPRGKKGDEIPETARVIAVADTFDAMYSTRPYRKQMLLSDVMAELKRISGTQLDEEVVQAMTELYEEGELDREKVDAAVFHAKNSIKTESDEEKKRKSDKLAEDNRKFVESLGLAVDDEEEGGKK